MICAKINGPTLFDARRQLNYASDYADMAELRMDLWARHKVDEVEKLIREHPDIPLIFVLRPKKESSELRRVNEIEELAVLKPGFFDIEEEMPSEIRRTLIGRFPKIQWIISANLVKFDENELNGIYEKHAREFPQTYFKITVKVNSIVEALRFCLWVHQKQDSHLIGIADGALGQISRVLSPLLGNPWTYASTDEKPNPQGLLSAQTLRETYCLNKKREFKNFLVHLSNAPSSNANEAYYNHSLEQMKLPTLYVELNTPELEHCWEALRQLPVYGATAGVPYEEEIMVQLDYNDPTALKIEAVNTVLIEEKYSYGFNTEGFGVLDAIEKHKAVYQEPIGIIGDGSAARAAVHEAGQRGAVVTIYSKNAGKGKQIAHEFGCEYETWGKWKKHSIWVIAGVGDVDIPVHKDLIIIDLSESPLDLKFLEKIKTSGAKMIGKEEVFSQQVSSQLFLWFNEG